MFIIYNLQVSEGGYGTGTSTANTSTSTALVFILYEYKTTKTNVHGQFTTTSASTPLSCSICVNYWYYDDCLVTTPFERRGEKGRPVSGWLSCVRRGDVDR